MPLGDFLGALQTKVPGLQVVTAAGGELKNLPVPHMSLKKVTLAQVLQLLENIYPDFEVKPIESDNSPTVYLFTMRSVPSPEGPQMRAFGLADRVDRLALRDMAARKAATGNKPEANAGPPIHPDAAARKEALKQIMSLIQATSPQAAIQLHEETETALVRGTQEQINLVQQALATLDSPALVEQLTRHLESFEASQSAILKQQEAHQTDLEGRLNAAMNQISTLQQQLLTARQELTEYKVRLEAAQAKSKGQ